MRPMTNADVNPDFLTIEYIDHFAVLKFGAGGFRLIDDLNTGGTIFSFLDNLEQNPDVYAIMIFNESVSLNRDSYREFVERASGVKIESGSTQIESYERPEIRTREVIFLQRLILRLMTLEKLVVRCISDEIATPMVGLSLACDMRFMADSARFTFPHVDYGIHPAGGLPFFLDKYLGHGRAMEILLRGNDINAEEARTLGLVNKVFSGDKFQETCINDISGICYKCTNSIKKTKRIMSVTVDELRHYFDVEAKQLA